MTSEPDITDQHFIKEVVEGFITTKIDQIQQEISQLRTSIDPAAKTKDSNADLAKLQQEVTQLRMHCEARLANIQTQIVQLHTLTANTIKLVETLAIKKQ